MIGSKCKMIIAIMAIFFLFNNFDIGRKSMEITKIINHERRINKFVSKNFELVSSSYQNPIFPCKVNFKMKTKTIIFFCNFPVKDCWLLKQDDLFSFYLLIKNDFKLVEEISKKYGEQLMESEVEANNSYIRSKSYYWETGQLNIILNKFRNINKITSYEDCVLVTVGNMSFSEIIDVSLK